MNPGRRFRPCLECLEDRLTPTAFFFPIAQSAVMVSYDGANIRIFPPVPVHEVIIPAHPINEQVYDTKPFAAALVIYGNLDVQFPPVPVTPAGLFLAAAPSIISPTT